MVRSNEQDTAQAIQEVGMSATTELFVRMSVSLGLYVSFSFTLDLSLRVLFLFGFCFLDSAFVGLRRLSLHFFRHKPLLLSQGWFCHIPALLRGTWVSNTRFFWLPSRI